MLSQIKVNCKKLYLIGLGFQSHYEYLQRNHQNYKNQHSFWVYDKAKLDIAYFLSKNKYDDGKMTKSTCLNSQGQKAQLQQLNDHRQGTKADDHQRKKYKRITYITRQNYETIQMRPRSSISNSNQTDQISKILKNNQFYIINSYRDAHPYQLYNKLSGYMNNKKCDQIRQLFRLSFSNHELSLRGSFLPEMQKIRSYYLDTSGLKLRVLDRLRNASEEEILKNVEKWKQFYQIQKVMNSNLYVTSTEEQSQKLNWIEQNLYVFEIEKKDILQGYGRKFKSFLAI